MAKAKKKEVEVEIPGPSTKGMIEKVGIGNPEELTARINRDFAQSEQIKWLWIPEQNQNVKDYFGVIQPSEWPFKGASQIKSQFQRIVVDTLSGNVIKSLFQPEHPIEAAPNPLGNKTTNDALDNIKYVEDLHNSIQANEYHLKDVLDKAIPTALIESYCVLHPVYEYLTEDTIVSITRYVSDSLDTTQLSYDLDTDTVTDLNGQMIPSFQTEAEHPNLKEVQFNVTKEEVVHDGISLKTINGYRFYMPLGTPGETPYEKVQNAPYVVHQLFYTVREVLEYSKTGYFENVHVAVGAVQKEYYEKIGKKDQGRPIIVSTTYDRQRELITYTKLREAGFLLDIARLEYEYVEVFKWCGKFEINGKLQNVIVWMDRNTGTILRVEQNIFGVKPYFPIVPYPIDETPYGESLCQIIRPLVQELNLLMRTVTNIALQKSAPAKFYDPASGFNPSTVGQFGPNSWIPAREPARNVLIPPQPEDPAAAMEMIKLIINFIERITGVSEVVQGQVAQRANTTAHEVDTALARSGVRFEQTYERIKSQLNPMFRYIHKLLLRYMPETKEIQLMGAENKGRFVKTSRALVKGDYNFSLVGNSIVNQQTELQNGLTLYNTLGQHPYVTYKPESIYYILYNIVKGLNPIAFDKILPKPEEVAKLERDKAKVQQEQEQMALQQQQQAGPSPEQIQVQAQAQGHIADLEAKKQHMQLDAAKQSQEMRAKELEHQQKLKHAQQNHELNLAQAKAMAEMQLQVQQQQADIQHAELIRRARVQAKESTDNSNA